MMLNIESHSAKLVEKKGKTIERILMKRTTKTLQNGERSRKKITHIQHTAYKMKKEKQYKI